MNLKLAISQYRILCELSSAELGLSEGSFYGLDQRRCVKDSGTMDSPPKIDVVDWQDSPLPIVPEARARDCFLPPTLIGILGTVLLHAMLVQSVSFGTHRPKPKLPEVQESANASSRSTANADSLVLISLPTIGKANQDATQNLVSSLPDLSKMKVKSRIDIDSPALLGLETLTLSEDQAPSAIADGADAAEQARLFGIYTGQIQARIARVWRRPRTPVNEEKSSVDDGESFQCEAQIVQDTRGNVREVMLPRCNGSLVWRNSLVLAIQHASPLPAPPSQKVFSTSITLNFVGLNYFAGAPDDDYEPAARRIVLRAQ
jgi:TonB-like protein